MTQKLLETQYFFRRKWNFQLKNLKTIYWDDYNILITAIKDSHGGINFNPKSEVTLSKGDTLIAFGKLENINALAVLK